MSVPLFAVTLPGALDTESVRREESHDQSGSDALSSCL